MQRVVTSFLLLFFRNLFSKTIMPTAAKTRSSACPTSPNISEKRNGNETIV